MQLVRPVFWEPEPEGQFNILQAVLVVSQMVEASRPVAVSQAQLGAEFWGTNDALCVDSQASLVFVAFKLKKMLKFSKEMQNKML